MKDRVKEILELKGLEFIKEKESKGYDKDYLVRKLISNKETPLEEVLLEDNNEQSKPAAVSGRMETYRNVLVKAIMTGIGLKEDIAATKAQLTEDAEVV